MSENKKEKEETNNKLENIKDIKHNNKLQDEFKDGKLNPPSRLDS